MLSEEALSFHIIYFVLGTLALLKWHKLVMKFISIHVLIIIKDSSYMNFSSSFPELRFTLTEEYKGLIPGTLRLRELNY